jgi:hypothetical protein
MLLHLAAVVVVAGCLLAFWWQLHRALGGNDLSWAYCFEWPIFAVLGAIGWWQLVHDDPRGEGHHSRPPAEPVSDLVPRWSTAGDEQDEELAAYNRYLSELAASGARKTWRQR